MAEEFRTNFTAQDDVSSVTRRIKAEIEGLKATLNSLGRSNLGASGISQAATQISNEITGLEKKLASLQSQYQKVGRENINFTDVLGKFQNETGRSAEAVIALERAKRGYAATVDMTTERELIHQNSIRTTTQTITNAINATTGLGNTTANHAQRQRELNAAFGATTAVASGSEGALRRHGAAAKETAKDIDYTTYATRKAITVFDEMARGQRGQLMSTIGSVFRDLGVGGAGSAFALGGLVVGAATIHAIEAVSHWTRELSALAEKQENVAAATGMTAQEFGKFSGAVQLAGGDTTTAARALESIQKQMLAAVLDPSSKVMDAFRKLGIGWDELRNRLNDPRGARNTLMDLADAYVSLGNTAERTARFTNITGGTRQFEEIVPILKNGAAGLRELEARHQALNPSIDLNRQNLVAMEHKIHELDDAWLGFKASVVGSGGMFSTILESLTQVLVKLQSYNNSPPGGPHTSAASAIPIFGAITAATDATKNAIAAYRTSQEKAAGTIVTTDSSGARVEYGSRFSLKAAEFNAAVDRAIANANAAGYSLAPGKRFRSYQEQVDIHNADPVGSANPGGSMHGYSLANDIRGSNGQKMTAAELQQVRPFFTEQGIGFPLEHWAKKPEPWHAELAEGRTGLAINWDRLGYGPNATPGMRTGLPSQRIPEPMAATPEPGALPVDWEEKAAERLYLARLKLRQVGAEELHQDQERQALLKQKADFEALGPEQRSKFLQENVKLGAAEANAQTQLLGTYGEQFALQKNLTQEQLQAQLAGLRKQEIEARGREDLKTVVELRQKELALVSVDPYKSRAERIQAEISLIQAKNELQKQTVALTEQEYAARAKANNDIARGFAAAMETRVASRGTNRISEIDALGFEIQKTYELATQQKDLLDKRMQAADALQDDAMKVRIYWQQWELGTATQTKVLELTKKIAETTKQEFDKAVAPIKGLFDSLGSSIESYLDAAISRTQTFADATRQLLTGLIKSVVKMFGDLGSQYLAKQLAATLGETLSPGAGLGGLASQMIGRGLGLGNAAKTGVDAVNNAQFVTGAANMQAFNAATAIGTTAKAASTAAEATGTATKVAATTAEGTQVATKIVGTGVEATHTAATLTDTVAVTANAAAQTAGAAGGIAGAAGGLGQVVSAIATGALMLERGGIVPSAAGGMMVGGSGGQLAILHPREMVLPASISSGMQNLISNGNAGGSGAPPMTFNYNANVTGYHPYETRASFETMLRQHGNSMMSWASNQARNGAFARS